MDATAVAAARGLAARDGVGIRHVAGIGLLFGGFQAMMPLLGYLAGQQLGPHVERYDHWIAFVLLGAIGAKMLQDARSPDADEAPSRRDLFRLHVLLVLALATSVDALAVGVTLPIIGAPLLLSLVTIGITTALLSGAGLVIGRRFGASLGKRLDVAGGLILIVLGTKILVEHLSGG